MALSLWCAWHKGINTLPSSSSLLSKERKRFCSSWLLFTIPLSFFVLQHVRLSKNHNLLILLGFDICFEFVHRNVQFFLASKWSFCIFSNWARRRRFPEIGATIVKISLKFFQPSSILLAGYVDTSSNLDSKSSTEHTHLPRVLRSQPWHDEYQLEYYLPPKSQISGTELFVMCVPPHNSTE